MSSVQPPLEHRKAQLDHRSQDTMDFNFHPTSAAVATQMEGEEVFNDLAFTTLHSSSGTTILDCNPETPPHYFMDPIYPFLDSAPPHMEDPSAHFLPEPSMPSFPFPRLHHDIYSESLSTMTFPHPHPHPASAPPTISSLAYNTQEIILEPRLDTPRPSTPEGFYRCECGLVLSSINKSKNQATHEKSASHRDVLGLPRHEAGNLSCCFCGHNFARSDAARRHERRCAVNPDNHYKRKRPYVRKDRKELGKVVGSPSSSSSSVMQLSYAPPQYGPDSDGTDSTTPISSGFPSTPMTAPLPTLPLAALPSPFRTSAPLRGHHKSYSDGVQQLQAFCSPINAFPSDLQARLHNIAHHELPSLHGFTSPPYGVPTSPSTLLESPYSAMSLSPSSPRFVIDGGRGGVSGYADADVHHSMATVSTLPQSLPLAIQGRHGVHYLPYGAQHVGEGVRSHHYHPYLSTAPQPTADREDSSLLFNPTGPTTSHIPAPASTSTSSHGRYHDSPPMSPVDYSDLSGLAPMYDLNLRSDFNDTFP